jgi:hypothetical protein
MNKLFAAVLVPAVLVPAVLAPAVLAPAVLAVVALPVLSAPAQAQNLNEVFRRANPSVVVIRPGAATSAACKTQ